jgi:hypothetical protein
VKVTLSSDLAPISFSNWTVAPTSAFLQLATLSFTFPVILLLTFIIICFYFHYKDKSLFPHHQTICRKVSLKDVKGNFTAGEDWREGRGGI